MKYPLLVLLLLCFSLGVVYAQENASLYQRSEKVLTWDDHNLSNPFTDVELKLYITAPGRKLGSDVEFYGFYDGNGSGGQSGDVWKYRICLDQPGPWTVKARFVEPGTNTQKSGAPQERTFTYQVAATSEDGEHGPIYVDRANNWRAYRHADGTPWVPLPFHASNLLTQSPDNYQEYIDEHKKRNIDALTVRFHDDDSKNRGLTPRYQWLKTNGKSATEWPGDRNKFDYDRFDLSAWTYQDRIVEYAHAQDMKLAIWFGISGINSQYGSYGPMDHSGSQTLGRQQKLFVKYILARWAAYTNWWHWTVNSEWEEVKNLKQLNINYALELRKMNPWKMPITNHSLRDWTLGGYDEGWDLAQIQKRVEDSNQGAIDSYKFVASNDNQQIPVFNIEGVWNLSPERTRVAVWSHLMAGGTPQVAYYETGSGSVTSWFAQWDGLNPNHKTSAAKVGEITAFFNKNPDIDISTSVPSDGLVTVKGGGRAFCLADAGKSYYVWLSTGGTPTVDLSAGSGPVAVYRYKGTDLGNPVKLANVDAGGEVTLPGTPDNGFGNDYLYVLKGNASATLQIATVSLPDGNENVAYSTSLESSNPSGTVEWSVVEGTLPAGLSLSGNTIAGTPTTAIASTFTIQAQDDNQTVTKEFTLRVNESDADAPRVTNVAVVDQKASNVTVTWTTDEPATSRVQWGSQPDLLEGESGENSALVTDHAVTIEDDFVAGTTYYLLIITSDANNNTAQEEASFTATLSSDPSDPPVSGRDAFVKIEAESLDEQQGVQLTSSVLGYFDGGDWAKYADLDFGSGAGSVDLRLAVDDAFAGKTIELRIDSPDGKLIGSLVTQGTGGWSSYQTRTTSVQVSGVHDLYLVGGDGGGIANLDWLVFRGEDTTSDEPIPPSANLDKIEAESANASQGVAITSSVIGYFDAGDWLKYSDVNFGSGVSWVDVAVATKNAGNAIELRLDSPTGSLIGVLPVQPTGDWNGYEVQRAGISQATGVHDLYLVAQGGEGVGNVDWFRFGGSSSARRAGTLSKGLPEEASQVRVYPNPVVDGQLWIRLPEGEFASVAVYNVLGEEVVARTVSGSQHVPLLGVPSGMYTVVVQTRSGTYREKIILESN